MKLKFIPPILIILSFTSCSKSRSTASICEILKIKNCNNSKRSLARSAGASLPSVNSAAFNNPAAISLNKGLGIESIHYQGEAQLGLVTGSGRVGAAISNFPNDGTFFGNTAIETVNSFRLRKIEGTRLKEEKVVLAGGFNLFGAKSQKGVQLDAGLIYRRNEPLNKDFGGGGLTVTINKVFSFGVASFKDIGHEDLRNKKATFVDSSGNQTTYYTGNSDYYVWNAPYNVLSYVAGVKFSNVAVDYIKFMTTFEEETYDIAESSIYNISYFYKKWIFSYGRRFEKSFQEGYEEEQFIDKEEKSFTFLGAQYATDNGFMLGAFTNYYLQNELSFGLTYFF